MTIETLPTRAKAPAAAPENLSRSLLLALALHALVAFVLLASAFLTHRASHWGDQNPEAGAVQASMVSALPLPPRQPLRDKAVLATDRPSPAPAPPPPTAAKPLPTQPKAAPLPKPNEVLIPTKTPTRLPPKSTPKPAEHPIAAATRPTPPAPPTPKATTGEAAGLQIPQSITQLKNGTASLTVDERSFGDRYAYYIRLIAQKINQSKSEGDPDPPETRGKRTVIRFTIDRDGTPTDAAVLTRSGAPSLDTSTLRAIQRIDTFGPLPAGDHITIRFEYDSR